MAIVEGMAAEPKYRDIAPGSDGGNVVPRTGPDIRVGLLTGGGDRPYVFGLALALTARDVCVDLIGGDQHESPEFHRTPNLNFINLRRTSQRGASLAEKASQVLMYYVRLILYAATARPKVFHVLWNNKFQWFDRTLLMLYYKFLGKKVILTAHNVNTEARDSSDTAFNRFTLKVQYRLSDRIFVHTERMKKELLAEFGVREAAVRVIPFGINNAVPNTALTPGAARRRLGLQDGEKTILFLGRIAPYKGLEYLVAAFEQIVTAGGDFRLIIAGQVKSKACQEYMDSILRVLNREGIRDRTTLKIGFLPDEDLETYFKAADVFVLPYTHIFQSGVLFLGYAFGTPVIASDVGSLREDIVEGKTGFLCQPKDSRDLARALETYFDSDMYRDLNRHRPWIREYAAARHSWDVVGEVTRSVYTEVLGPTVRVDGR